MAIYSLGLEMRAEGTAQTVAEFKKAQAAIAAMKKETKGLNDDFQSLANLLGIDYEAAKAFSSQLGLSAEVAKKAVTAYQKLVDVNAPSKTKFQALSSQFGINSEQYKALERMFQDNVINTAQRIIEKQARFERNSTALQEVIQANNKEAETQIQSELQQRMIAFEDMQRAKALEFQQSLQADEAQFQTKQLEEKQVFAQRLQADEARFQERLTQRRASNQLAFSTAAERVDQAIAVTRVPIQEQGALRAKFRQENLAQERTQQAIAKLNLVNQTFSVDQILKLAQRVTGARLNTEVGAKQVQGAVRAIRDEQERQQQAADQKERLKFEQGLQQKRFQFDQQQRSEAQAFQVQQRSEEIAFRRSQQDEERGFRQQEQAIKAGFEEERRQLNHAFAVAERELERNFRQELQADEAVFRTQERLLDEKTAGRVRDLLTEGKVEAILAKGKTQPVQARRLGGDVQPDEPYLVGEAGPELIFPNRAGYVATARETAAMMDSVPLPSMSGVVASSPTLNLRTLEKQNAELIQINRGLAARIAAIADRPRLVENTHYYATPAENPLRGTGL